MRRPAIHLVAACLCAGVSGASASDWLMEEGPPQQSDFAMDDRAPARDEVHPTVRDLRVGGGILTSPRIEEDIDVPGTGHAHYDWVGASGSGFGGAISAVSSAWQPARRWGSLTLGAELQVQHFDSTPDSYRVAGTGLVTNNQRLSLEYQTVALDLIAGWATTPCDTPIGDLHLEALAVGGYGLVWADTQGFTTGGSPTKRRGAGSGWNIGPRLGVYLAESRWVFGVHGDWIWSKGQVDITLPAGQTSHIEAMGNGAAGTIEIGYRF